MSRGARAALRTLAVAAVAAAACTHEPSTPPLVLAGEWGGAQAALTVDDRGARIELVCADGRIEGAVPLDDGAFDATGPWAPGPVPPSEARTARYTGRVDGGRLLLTIRPDRGDPPIGPLALERNAPLTFPRCQ